MTDLDKNRSLFAELQRRNVHRAAVFYAGAAWLLVQIATQVFPFFHIEEWVVRCRRNTDSPDAIRDRAFSDEKPRIASWRCEPVHLLACAPHETRCSICPS